MPNQNKKWWVGLVQGSYWSSSVFLFSQPLNAMKGLSIWIGLLILFTGLVGIFSWMAADRIKETLSLWALTIVFGIVMLMNLFTTTRIVEILWIMDGVLDCIYWTRNSSWSIRPSMGNSYCRGLCLFAAVVLILDLGTVSVLIFL
jgi:uncharacterized membrane protein HdeD (DUF308 family)